MRKMLLTSTAFPTAQITEAFLDLLEQAPTELTAAIITTAAVELREQARPSVKAKQALDIRIVDHFTPHFNQVGMTHLDAIHLNETIIFPHYGREDKFPDEKSHEQRILEFEAAHHCEVERLADKEAIYINGDKVRKITCG